MYGTRTHTVCAHYVSKEVPVIKYNNSMKWCDQVADAQKYCFINHSFTDVVSSSIRSDFKDFHSDVTENVKTKLDILFQCLWELQTRVGNTPDYLYSEQP